MTKSLLIRQRLHYNNNSSTWLNDGPTLNHVQLSCSIPVATAITKSSHICSHQ